MADLYEFLRVVQFVVYLALGASAIRQWLKNRSPSTMWLALTFATLALIVLISRFLPENSDEAWVKVLERLIVALLPLFPYFLWRFSLSFVAPVRWFWNLAHVLTALVVVFGLLIELPDEGEPRSAVVQGFILLLLVQWVTLSGRVTWRLWRAGNRLPVVARRRMRTMALGSAALAVALVIAGLVQPSEEVHPWQIVTQLFALAAGPLFLIGFAPPGIVRMAWRRPEEEALAAAQKNLMAATTPDEVAGIVLPHAARLVGGGRAMLLDRTDEVIAAHGTSEGDPVDGSAEEGRQVLDLENGCLILYPSRFAPFFGREESDMMRTLAVMADLALSRAGLFVDLRRSNAELEQFAYVASHDLQEPLRTVTSYAELLQRRYQGQMDEKADKYIWYVSDGCTRMQTLINDLLAFSRVGTRGNDPSPHEARDLVDNALQALSQTIRETGAEVEVGDLPRVYADDVQVTQLFQNMIGNAIKYRKPDETPRVQISASSEGGPEETFTIADNGIGIDPKYAERIFTIFQRLHTRDEYPGTGIGLAICKKIVERHGGRIWLDDRPGGGATFHFTLPRAR